MEYAWRIQSETSAGMWSGKKKRVLISLLLTDSYIRAIKKASGIDSYETIYRLFDAKEDIIFSVQIEKRMNSSSFSLAKKELWSLLANSQSNFIQFYYSINKIPTNRYFANEKKFVSLHKLN